MVKENHSERLDAAVPPLRIECLGTPQIWLNGQKVKFRTRKAMILMIYLITETGLHSREKLAALFWANSDEHQARIMLRTTLNHLHQALEDAYDHFLVTDRYTVGFNPDFEIGLDLQLIQQAFNASTVANDPQTLNLLQNAARAYRGSFLETTILEEAPEIEQWILVEQEKYRHQINAILERLTLLQCELGLFEQAMQTALLWNKHDPLKEKGYHYLIQTYWVTGNRLAARQTYQFYQSKLILELGEGAEPSDDLQQLMRRIEHSPDTTENIPVSADQTADLVVPFVGRTVEYQQLIALYQRCRTEGLQLVEIEGEAGIGKTRLMTEFLKWAAVNGADVVRSKGIEVHHRMPFHLWVEAFRVRLDQENAPEDLLDNVWLLELTRLFPELVERYPDLGVTLNQDAAARSRLFEAVTRLGIALAHRAPLVILFDDMQWADADTWDLLLYATRRWSEKASPIMLALLHRSEQEVPEQHDQLAEIAPLHSLALSPLEPDDIQAMVAKALYGETNTRPVEALLSLETAGHPFFMVEILRELVERKQIDVTNQRQIKIYLTMDMLPQLRGMLPKGLKRLVANRLKSLSGDAVTLLTAGAVLGDQFTFDTLVAMVNLEEMAAAQGMEELLRKRCLSEQPAQRRAQPSRYAFTHDKLREVLYAELTEVRRSVLHRRALEVLQERGTPAIELAYHAFQGQRWDFAIQYSLSAGDQALQIFAARDAIAAYEQVLQIADYHATPAVLLGSVHYKLGQAFSILSAYETAMQHYQQCLDVAEWEMQARNGLGKMLLFQGQFDEAKAYFSTVYQDTLSTQRDELLLDALWGLSAVEGSLGQYDAAIEYATQGADLCRTNDTYRLAGFLGNLGKLWGFKGNFEQSMLMLQESLSLSQAIHDDWRSGNILLSLGETVFEHGDAQAAYQYYTSGLEVLRKIGNKTGMGDALLGLASIALERENYAECCEYLEACFPIFQETKDQWGIRTVWGNLGILAMFQEDYPNAVANLEQGFAIAREMGDRSGMAHLERHLGLVAMLQGDFRKAHQYLESARQTAQEIARPLMVVGIDTSLGALYLMEHDSSAAAAALHCALSAACEHEAEGHLLETLSVYTRWYVEQGELAKAGALRSLILSHPKSERYSRLYMKVLLESPLPQPSHVAESLKPYLDELLSAH